MDLVLLSRLLLAKRKPGGYSIRFSSASSSFSFNPQPQQQRYVFDRDSAIRVMLVFKYLCSTENGFDRYIRNNARNSSSRIATLHNFITTAGSRWFEAACGSEAFMDLLCQFLGESCRFGTRNGQVINASFTWSSTREGQEYWSEMNERCDAFFSYANSHHVVFDGLPIESIKTSCLAMINSSNTLRSWGNNQYLTDRNELIQELARVQQQVSGGFREENVSASSISASTTATRTSPRRRLSRSPSINPPTGDGILAQTTAANTVVSAGGISVTQYMEEFLRQTANLETSALDIGISGSLGDPGTSGGV